MHYAEEELDNAALLDLLADADSSERQAIEGPFFPDRGITSETLKAYARECRAKAERYRVSGAHKAVLNRI